MTKPQVVVVGLGPGGAEWIDGRTHRLLMESQSAFVRTTRHPASAAYSWAGSFDDVYDSAPSIESVYAEIVERLLAAATASGSGGPIVYAVPGSPFVAERSIRLLLERAPAAGVEVDVWPATSFLDVAWARLGLDPIAAGVSLIDGHDIGVQLAGRPGPYLVAQVDRIEVLDELRAAWEQPPTRVVLLRGLGTAEESIVETSLAELREHDLDHLTSLFIDGVSGAGAAELVRFVELVATLRERCPWDREQTHASLRRHLVEETYEVLEAIDALPAGAGTMRHRQSGRDSTAPTVVGDDNELDPREEGTREDGTAEHGHPVEEVDSSVALAYEGLEEELGDLLFQVAFHSRLAAEAGQFELADVARTVHDKLVTRHPHVFGTVDAHTADSVVSNWEQIKKAEKGRSSLMDGIPRALPALLFATKVQRKAASIGFDFASVADAMGKVHEEIGEFLEAGTEDELGDLLFAVVNVGRLAGWDCEAALRIAADKFVERFRFMEAAADDGDLSSRDLAQLDQLWDQAKSALAQRRR